MTFIARVAFHSSAVAQQQTGAQVGAQANNQTSVQADKTHA